MTAESLDKIVKGIYTRLRDSDERHCLIRGQDLTDSKMRLIRNMRRVVRNMNLTFSQWQEYKKNESLIGEYLHECGQTYCAPRQSKSAPDLSSLARQAVASVISCLEETQEGPPKESALGSDIKGLVTPIAMMIDDSLREWTTGKGVAVLRDQLLHNAGNRRQYFQAFGTEPICELLKKVSSRRDVSFETQKKMMDLVQKSLELWEKDQVVASEPIPILSSPISPRLASIPEDLGSTCPHGSWSDCQVDECSRLLVLGREMQNFERKGIPWIPGRLDQHLTDAHADLSKWVPLRDLRSAEEAACLVSASMRQLMQEIDSREPRRTDGPGEEEVQISIRNRILAQIENIQFQKDE